MLPSNYIIILFLVTGHVMENHLTQLSVTEAAEVTDVCSYSSEVSSVSTDPNWNLSDSTRCNKTHQKPLLMFNYEKLFHRIFPKAVKPDTWSSLNVRTGSCLWNHIGVLTLWESPNTNSMVFFSQDTCSVSSKAVRKSWHGLWQWG